MLTAAGTNKKYHQGFQSVHLDISNIAQ